MNQTLLCSHGHNSKDWIQAAMAEGFIAPASGFVLGIIKEESSNGFISTLKDILSSSWPVQMSQPH